MIYSIRGENIYNVLNAQSNLTSLVEFFNTKPDEEDTPDWSYAYLSIVSDVNKTYSNVGYLMKTARVSVHIVCKKVLWSAETEERVLRDITDAITNTIVSEWCPKISNWDWFIVNSVIDETISPIFTLDTRGYLVKDYIFNYLSNSNE